MINTYIKATNKITNEVIYDCFKKSYKYYSDALKDMKKLLGNQNAYITSFRLPSEPVWDIRSISCYISCKHGNCRTTVYLKQQ